MDNPFKNTLGTQEPKELPFDATKTGIAINTILGLPKAFGEVMTDIGQSIARNIGSAAITITGSPFSKERLGGTGEQISSDDIKSNFGQEVFKRIFGDEPIKSIEQRISETELKIQNSPTAKTFGVDKFSLPLAFGLVVGDTALDLSPLGGEKNAIKQLVKEESIEGVSKILKNIKVPDEIVSIFSPKFAESKTEKEVVNLFEQIKQTTGMKKTVDNIPIPPEDSVSKLLTAIKGADKPRTELEAIYTAERAKRATDVEQIFSQANGRQGFYDALGKLAGELAPEKPKFDMLKLEQKDTDNLFNMIQSFKDFDVYTKISASNGLQKIFFGEIPQDSQLKLLEKIFGTDFVDAVMTKKPFIDKVKDFVTEMVNVPRSLITSLDMSAVLRQGIIQTVSHPVKAIPAFKEMFLSTFSPKHFEEWFKALPSHPFYKQMNDAKLYIADPLSHIGGLSAKEEKFMTNFAEKIPIFGNLIKASERAYVGFLNKIRVDTFSRMAEQYAKADITTPKLLKDAARYVNNSTGRGGLGKLENFGRELNSIFFSPRLLTSRFNMLNPVFYARLSPPVRKQAMHDMAKFIGTGMTVLGLAEMNGAEVEKDPTSSDFMKIKIGNTRFDVWGGFQQWVRVFSQIVAGQVKSTGSGNVYKLNQDKFPFTSRTDVALQFMRGKLSPGVSSLIDLVNGQNVIGEKFNLSKEAYDNSIPLYIQDMIQAVEDLGPDAIWGIGIPGFLGVGTQTYDTQKKTGVGNPFSP